MTMDPDVALDVLKRYFNGGVPMDFDDAEEAFDALDEWLAKGDHLPKVWQR